MAAPEILGKTNTQAQDAKSKVQMAEKDFEKMSHEAGSKIGAMASEFAHSASEYVETGRGYVKSNPGKSVAIAAAAGLVAGSLITLAMSRRK